MRSVSAVGSPGSVAAAIGRVIERTRADEIIVSGATYDPAARRRSLELTAKVVA
jgi:alkanesulfonate monooxygenase SsuD/methylene tetrahydromethanopterin reductase-like flavin-dependent oxidoreductase (luciferase family)